MKVTKNQFIAAKQTIKAYQGQRIKNHKIKTGDIYLYRGQLMSVRVYFDTDKDSIWYSWDQPHNYRIENGEIKMMKTLHYDENIFKEGEKTSQIEGEELERLQRLNDMAYYDFQDIDSKEKELKLRKERQTLIKKCCHVWENTGGWNREQRTCKICYAILEAE